MACSSRSDFEDKVKYDIEKYVEIGCVKSVLVFPAVNSYCRFVIHQLIQTSFKDYFTFSIGQEPDRRIVVCPKNILSSENGNHSSGLKAATTAQSPGQRRTMVVGPDETITPTQPKKSRTVLPTAQIYRPPAARKPQNEIVIPPPLEAPPERIAPKARVRRPDQQVYVPRAKRLSAENTNTKPDVLGSPNYTSAEQTESRQSLAKVRTNSNSSQNSACLRPHATTIVTTKKNSCQSTSSSDLEYEFDSNNRINPSERDTMADLRNIAKVATPTSGLSLRPRAEALVEKKKRLCQSNLEPDDFQSRPKTDVPSVHGLNTNAPLVQRDDDVQVRPEGNNNPASDTLLISENVHCAVIDSVKVTTNEEICNPELLEDSKELSADNEVAFSQVNVSHEVLPNCKESVDVSSTLELPLYSSGYTSDSPPSSESGSNHSLSSIGSCDDSKTSSCNDRENSIKNKRTQVFNPDECDWDDLLDENGECLDPFLMKELTHAVGEVSVSRPHSDYSEFQSQAPADGRPLRRPDDDFGHVLEIYSFPPEFKTQDLMAVFLPFKNTGGGFEIKWVDDTHALGVFASSIVATEVLQYRHPLVRTRPLSEGIQESRLKARRLSDSIQSYRPRPATCAALARRLVTGALGVKLKTARQEREEEKKVLQEARERRRLAAKQRDEIWND